MSSPITFLDLCYRLQYFRTLKLKMHRLSSFKGAVIQASSLPLLRSICHTSLSPICLPANLIRCRLLPSLWTRPPLCVFKIVLTQFPIPRHFHDPGIRLNTTGSINSKCWCSVPAPSRFCSSRLQMMPQLPGLLPCDRSSCESSRLCSLLELCAQLALRPYLSCNQNTHISQAPPAD